VKYSVTNTNNHQPESEQYEESSLKSAPAPQFKAPRAKESTLKSAPASRLKASEAKVSHELLASSHILTSSARSSTNNNSTSKVYAMTSGLKKFIVKGQGVVEIKQTHPGLYSEMTFELGRKKNFTLSQGFTVKVSSEGVKFYTRDGSHLTEVPIQCYYKPFIFNFESNCSHWISLDSYNGKLYYGQGEVRKETILFIYEFVRVEWAHKIKYVGYNGYPGKLVIWRDPVVLKTPLLIKKTDEITMVEAAKYEAIVPANLSTECRKLFENVAGKQFKLNSADFTHFSDAINWSINNKNGWCYKKLIDKATEFGEPNPKATYLRITLGVNQGSSPGVPYVMEIWPAGHYSPIHNHAGANAVIRVLHGNITTKLFSYFSAENQKEFASQVFYEDDITFITPELNQTHQLINEGDSACITIQCYLYNDNDQSHYEYFDYIGNDGKTIGHFDPDSDMDFLEFQEQMKHEWEHFASKEIQK